MEVPKYLVHVPCHGSSSRSIIGKEAFVHYRHLSFSLSLSLEREMVTNGESSDERDLSRNADTINRALREAGRRDCRKLIARSGE